MQQRMLGTQGLAVSAVGLGCMGMTFAYGTADEGRSLQTLERALELGVSFWDTSELYGPRTNEELLARVLAAHRDAVVVATKFGARSLEDPDRGPDGRPEYLRRACDQSLERLGTDVIDLYYQHRVDPQVPIEETVGAMAELVQAGKVRFLGLSEAAPDTVRRANAVHPISALQTEYSLWTRDVEADILPTLRELGVGLVPYSPLGRGFLTGRFRSPDDLPADDWRRGNPRFTGENFDANLRLVDQVQQLAETKGCTPGQLALAWVLAQGEDLVPIPGTTHPDRLAENAGALDLQLTRDELDRLEEIAPVGVAQGTRYEEAAMGSLDG